MNRHHTITPIAGLLLAACAATPAVASASPLLSGYGGPGQGSQVILGTALLNGPGSGGGGSAGTSAGTSIGTASESPSGALGGSSAHAQTSTAPSSQGRIPSSPGRIRKAPSRGFSVYPASEPVVRQSGTSGLSGDDTLYVISALGTLALAALLTRRLTRATDAGRRRS